MKKWTTAALAISMLGYSAGALAAPTVYMFDTITSALTGTPPDITVIQGTEKDTGLPLVASFNELGYSANDQFGMNRCVPFLITMMEKPGRYYLRLVVDTAVFTQTVRSCGLILR